MAGGAGEQYDRFVDSAGGHCSSEVHAITEGNGVKVGRIVGSGVEVGVEVAFAVELSSGVGVEVALIAGVPTMTVQLSAANEQRGSSALSHTSTFHA